MTASEGDIVERLAGIEAGSPVHAARALREQARRETQASYRALFTPEAPGDFSVPERCAVAAFVAGLHREADPAAFYRARLVESGAPSALADAVDEAARIAAGEGPYGHYPAGPLSREDRPGPELVLGVPLHDRLGPRLATAFEHAHMLVFHPRDAAPAHLQSLLDANWSTDSIVTLSQLVAFLAYQIRAAAGLRVLAAQS